MEVILLENHSKLGKLGDVVSVKNGYARNFLIPKKIAVRASKDNKEHFEKQKAQLQKDLDKKVAEFEKLKSVIDGHSFTLIRQASDDGKLYGSVTSANIAQSINDTHALNISKSSIIMHDQIKYIGKYFVSVEFISGVEAEVAVIVARSEEEAEILSKGKEVEALQEPSDTKIEETVEVATEEVIEESEAE